MHYGTISSHNMIDNNKSIKYSKFLRNKHAEFFKLFIVKKIFQEYTSGQIVMSGLIWVQTVCTGLVLRVRNENFIFLFLNQNMLWVLKRTVSMRWFFLAPKTYVETDG